MNNCVFVVVVVFQSDKNSSWYGNLLLPLTYNGKSENCHLLLSHYRYFDKSYTEMFLE